jgi:hypothetical protein
VNPSPALSCQPCLLSVYGWHTPQTEGSQAGHGSQPITPPAAISGRNGMAAISCAFRRSRQFVAACRRAGQGATFHPHSSKAPMGFSPFQDTAGGSQYPPAVPPSRAVARPGTPPSERRGGVFSEQSPDGVFTIRAPGSGPIEASTEKSVRVGGELFPLPGAIFSQGPAVHGRKPGELRGAPYATTPESLAADLPAMHRGAFPRGLKRYGTCVHLSSAKRKGGPLHEAFPLTQQAE